MIREGKVWFGSVGVRPQSFGGTAGAGDRAVQCAGGEVPRRLGDPALLDGLGGGPLHLARGEQGVAQALRRLRRGAGPDWAPAGGSARAWQQVYPEISLTDLDGRIRDHLNKAFAVPKSSMVGFALTHPPNPPLTLEPAQMSYVDKIRAELKKRRRSERLF